MVVRKVGREETEEIIEKGPERKNEDTRRGKQVAWKVEGLVNGRGKCKWKWKGWGGGEGGRRGGEGGERGGRETECGGDTRRRGECQWTGSVRSEGEGIEGFEDARLLLIRCIDCV